MFQNSRQPERTVANPEDSLSALQREEDETVTPSVFESLKASFSVVLVALSSIGGGVETNSNHSCSGCPTCLPPPRVEVMKKKEDQNSDGE